MTKYPRRRVHAQRVATAPVTVRCISAPRRNIELKARDPDRARSLSICNRLGAEPRGVLAQRDTYFTVSNGRLKLREEVGGRPHLIAYQRPDRIDGRESAYRLVEVHEAQQLLEALSSTIGVKAVIVKRRQLFVWEGVRIHLDDVEGLGRFVEFEAIASRDSDLAEEKRQVQRLREAFSLADDDLVAGSYCDLVEASR